MAHSVDLLYDKKGLYGVGVADDVCWTGLGPIGVEWNCKRKLKIVLRADLLLDKAWSRLPVFDDPLPVLQRITSGPVRGLFHNYAEGQLHEIMHYHMLQRAGFSFDEGANPDGRDGRRHFWATDHKQETTNRKRYHGLRIGSLRIINALIAKALVEAAEPDALRESRRFALNHRYEIYRPAAVSRRFLQLVNVFPLLALYMTRLQGDEIEALKLLDQGAPLKNVAGLLGVPMALRRVKPGAAHLALGAGRGIFVDHPDLIYAYMPQSLPLMKFWLRKVMFAGRVDPDFARFTAKKLFTFGETTEEISARLTNTADWVDASARQNEFVTRPFNAEMSVKTATRLSNEWHETVARIQAGPAYPFPEPWIPGANVDGYQIIPITDNAELYSEGHVMHHCVGTYGPRVVEGDCYIYSLRKDAQRLATIQLVNSDGRIALGQIQGVCNKPVSKTIELAARKWLKSHKSCHPPKRPIIVPPGAITRQQQEREEEEAIAQFQALVASRCDAQRSLDTDRDS